MKPKLTKRRCKICSELYVMYNSLRPYCSASCGSKYALKLIANKEKKEASDWRKEKKILGVEVYSKEYRSAFQREINKLSRLIDNEFWDSCIDCKREYGKQVDGAHFHSVGANSSTRWNLHNIHSASSQCNKFSDTHKEGYRIGLIERYGNEYMEMIDNLPLRYKLVKLSNKEVFDKLAIVRKLIKTFDTYNLISPVSARDIFNKLIGIYE